MNYFNKIKDFIKEKLFKSVTVVEPESLNHEAAADIQEENIDSSNDTVTMIETESQPDIQVDVIPEVDITEPDNIEVESMLEPEIAVHVEGSSIPVAEELSIEQTAVISNETDIETTVSEEVTAIVEDEDASDIQIEVILPDEMPNQLTEAAVESVQYISQADGRIQAASFNRAEPKDKETAKEGFVAHYYKNGRKHMLTMTNLTPPSKEKVRVEENESKSTPVIDTAKQQETETVQSTSAPKKDNPLGFLDEEFESDLDKIINSKDFVERASKLVEVPDFKDNKDYISDYQSDDEMSEEALEMLVYANKRLVYKVVQRYKGMQSVSFTEDDMFQHGMIGLMKAAKKFDLNKGFEFSTYAMHWIRQEITRGIMDQSNTVRIPVHMGEFINKIRRKERECSRNFGMVDYEWIAEELEQPLEKIIEAVRVQNTFMTNVSLDVPVGTDEDSTLGEFIRDPDVIDPSSYVIDKSLQAIIFSLLDDLKPRERDIIIKRFGLDGKDIRTLETIGQDQKVTRERIRQIEAKALKRLRHPTRREQLKEYYEVY
ncbi:sigma-70 family RNA polymerase sigma factor [Aerococcaceae bacterium DSM 111176]|nr:sigma-70 family RNA polymerase sigma factor [Aerococcaceae bacterium DSM 111176]